MGGRLSLRPGAQHLHQSAGLGPHLHQPLVHLLVDPGDSDEPGGPGLQQGVHQSSLQGSLVSKPDRGSAEEAQIDVDDLGRHVTEGQVGDADLLVVVPVEDVLTGLDDPGDVVLTQ